MKIDTDEHGGIELRDVYAGVLFVTAEGHRYGVCMRDDTIEVIVNGDAPQPRIFQYAEALDAAVTAALEEAKQDEADARIKAANEEAVK